MSTFKIFTSLIHHNINIPIVADSEEDAYDQMKELCTDMNITEKFVWRDKVYQCIDSNIVFIGYYIPEDKIVYKPKLIDKEVVLEHPELYIMYDGSLVTKDVLLKEELESYTCFNPIVPQATMKTDTGYIHCSSVSVPGLAQHVFYPIPKHVTQLNELEQWFCGSKDLNSEEYIGYVFTSGEQFMLNQVNIYGRLGTQESPGLIGPTPKIMHVECTEDGTTWERITADLTMTDWEFMDVRCIDFKDSITTPFVGFRIVISEWNPGAQPNMFLGIYKLQFICTPCNLFRLPKLESPSETFVYARHDLRLIEKIDNAEQDKNITIPTVKEEVTLVTPNYPNINENKIVDISTEQIEQIVLEVLNREFEDTISISREQISNIVKDIFNKELVLQIQQQVSSFIKEETIKRFDYINTQITSIQTKLQEMQDIKNKNNISIITINDQTNNPINLDGNTILLVNCTAPKTISIPKLSQDSVITIIFNSSCDVKFSTTLQEFLFTQLPISDSSGYTTSKLFTLSAQQTIMNIVSKDNILYTTSLK